MVDKLKICFWFIEVVMGFMVVVLIMKIFFVIMVIDYGGKFKFGYSG